ncbi:hypothetical protein [Streptomyces glaucosporus]|uniref:hypothetical protein n=1 Tax=Streptomyces glaucosporus TaxID=284044 RepID=UPI0031D58754
MICTTELTAGALFALGFLAALVGAVFTGGFTVGGLLVTILARVSAGSGFVGRQRRRVAFSRVVLGWLSTTMALSQVITG